ncbi:MAG: polyprenyl synthetase family protein [Acidobacteria bacterium]|nr:polyprenyl synthetase family protein [Acidobacteriota bacterium]
MPLNLNEYLKQNTARLDQWLDRLLPSVETPPAKIHEAMRYSVFAGGKRLRPTLVIAAGELFNAPEAELLPTACALEMIHTYSLIHDDLPAMDNDTLRRGRPTNHVVYGEAMAILAGDALLTQAFIALSGYATVNEARKVRVIAEVAQAAGTVRALIGGQVLDMQHEGDLTVTGAQLEEIHRAKTGALIRCAIRVGAIIGCASENELAALTEYSEKAGLAFQVADDVLDATATSEALGKTAGKDAAVQKATYTALYGVEDARQRAQQLCDEALAALERIERDTESLSALARFIIARQS